MLHFREFRISSSELENKATTPVTFHHLFHLVKSVKGCIDVGGRCCRWFLLSTTLRYWWQQHLKLSPSWKRQHEVKTKMTVAVCYVMLTRDRLTVLSELVLKYRVFPNLIWFRSLDALTELQHFKLARAKWNSVIPGLPNDVKLVFASAVVANDSVNAYLIG